MTDIWNRVAKLLKPPKHPGNARTAQEPIIDALQDARAAWQSEQTIANAARYITLLELSRRVK